MFTSLTWILEYIQELTVHVDVLAQFDQLHLRGHVTHGPHQIPQILARDQPILVFVKLIESVPQLCKRHAQTQTGPHKTHKVENSCNSSRSAKEGQRTYHQSHRQPALWTGERKRELFRIE